MLDPRRADWRPLPPAELRALLETQHAPWWIAGGTALELFAGRSWREHGDLDAGILRADQPAVYAALPGWRRFAAHDGELRELGAGELAPPEANSLWCRHADESAFRFELLLDASDGAHWTFRRDPRVRLPLAELALRTRDGCPYLRPEVQLLYKAKARRPKDEADFAVVAPLLDARACDWLRRALALVDPAHAWLTALARSTR